MNDYNGIQNSKGKHDSGEDSEGAKYSKMRPKVPSNLSRDQEATVSALKKWLHNNKKEDEFVK
jgi:hypothetical protein